MTLTKVSYAMINGTPVNVLDFGADPTNTEDSTAAIQAATDTGSPVYFPAGSYKMLGTVSYTGTVVWQGEGAKSIINNDSTVLSVTDGDNSFIDNLNLVNITAPWIITRDPSDWATVPTVVQSNGLGYQPTVNDADVWSSLTTQQQNQDVGPKLFFEGNASNITVSNITGRFVTIALYDATQSTVRDCNFQGGKGLAGIVFWNINDQAGSYNQAINNNVQYASYSGIAYARNYNGMISGNIIQNVGESGIKTWQNTTGGVDARCYRMQIENNSSLYCYYDGFDFSSDYPHTGTIDSRHVIIGNNTFGNRQTGFYADGINNIFTNNEARGTGVAGIHLYYNKSIIGNNFVWGCNTSASGSENQMTIEGNNNNLSNNLIENGGESGYAIYAPGANFVSSNFGISGTNFFGNNGGITSVLANNIDSTNVMTGVVADGTKWYQLPAPTTAPTSTLQNTSSVTYWLDQSGNNLKFQVRYSNGTVKTATVAVV